MCRLRRASEAEQSLAGPEWWGQHARLCFAVNSSKKQRITANSFSFCRKFIKKFSSGKIQCCDATECLWRFSGRSRILYTVCLRYRSPGRAENKRVGQLLCCLEKKQHKKDTAQCHGQVVGMQRPKTDQVWGRFMPTAWPWHWAVAFLCCFFSRQQRSWPTRLFSARPGERYLKQTVYRIRDRPENRHKHSLASQHWILPDENFLMNLRQ